MRCCIAKGMSSIPVEARIFTPCSSTKCDDRSSTKAVDDACGCFSRLMFFSPPFFLLFSPSLTKTWGWAGRRPLTGPVLARTFSHGCLLHSWVPSSLVRTCFTRACCNQRSFFSLVLRPQSGSSIIQTTTTRMTTVTRITPVPPRDRE